MNHLSLVWDVLFVESAITDRKSARIVLPAMGEHTDRPVRLVMNWNTVREGQKTSGSGYTSGLRFVMDITDSSTREIDDLNELLCGFSHELAASNTISIAESLPLPLDRRTRKSFPLVGRLMLSVRFTHGLGYDDAKSIKNAIGTQTKETKDGLDPLRLGKGSSGKRFSEAFRSLMSDSYWFRFFPTGGREWNEINVVTGAADGGVYELAYDLRDAIEGLVEQSEGGWWNQLDPDELTLTPKLVVDMTDPIDSSFDPSDYYHLKQDFGFGPQARFKPLTCPDCQHDCRGNDDKCCPECGRSKILIENLINNVIENEMVQTGDEAMLEDLRYKLGRLTRGRRIPRQLTSEHGLVQGLERGLIGQEVIRPWLIDEFVNCLGFFLMTRKPKYWRNGTAEILLVQPYSDKLVESLKEV